MSDESMFGGCCGPLAAIMLFGLVAFFLAMIAYNILMFAGIPVAVGITLYSFQTKMNWKGSDAALARDARRVSIHPETLERWLIPVTLILATVLTIASSYLLYERSHRHESKVSAGDSTSLEHCSAVLSQTDDDALNECKNAAALFGQDISDNPEKLGNCLELREHDLKECRANPSGADNSKISR